MLFVSDSAIKVVSVAIVVAKVGNYISEAYNHFACVGEKWKLPFLLIRTRIMRRHGRTYRVGSERYHSRLQVSIDREVQRGSSRLH